MPLAQEIRTLVRAPRGREVPIQAAASDAEVADAEVADAEVVGPEASCEEDRCEGEWKRHKVSLTLGGAVERDELGGVIGLGYEYRLDRYLGVSIAGEYLTGDFRESSIGVGINLHPTERLFLVAAVGTAFEKLREGGELLVRLGGGYDFEIRDGFGVAPSLYVDFVKDRPPVFIFAFEFGKGW
ncbi:MAG: hypothetical protein P1V36_05950 [Planctomycetota bacterium]|nr:hypothetical protein [Planctomycetota bacterium]